MIIIIHNVRLSVTVCPPPPFFSERGGRHSHRKCPTNCLPKKRETHLDLVLVLDLELGSAIVCLSTILTFVFSHYSFAAMFGWKRAWLPGPRTPMEGLQRPPPPPPPDPRPAATRRLRQLHKVSIQWSPHFLPQIDSLAVC